MVEQVVQQVQVRDVKASYRVQQVQVRDVKASYRVSVQQVRVRE